MKHSMFIKSGIYGGEIISSTKTLFTDTKICSKHLYGTCFEKFCAKTSKQLVRNFQKLVSGGRGRQFGT